MNANPTHIDLFSGIGGFALAAQWAGFRTVAFCEIEPYCQALLKERFRAVMADADEAGFQATRTQQQSARTEQCVRCPKLYGDIRRLDGRDYRGADLLTGGFPCQPFSVAGKRAGASDDRFLWPEMLRVISEAEPAWVLGENVAGIVNMELDRVLSDLEGIGYECWPLVIPACAVDAKHRRDRVWIMGHAERAKRWTDVERGGNSEQRKHAEWQAASRSGESCEDVANAESIRSEQAADGREQGKSVLELGGEGCCAPCIWQPEPAVGRVVDGLSAELDFVRQITTYVKQSRDPKKNTARNTFVWKMLRAVWEHHSIAETSPELYIKHLRDSVPEVPLQDAQGRWLLGERIESERGLRDMWQKFYSSGFASSQDLQFKLLERSRETKRSQTVGNRVDRLKGLGNAIVPKVAFQILNEIRRIIA